MQSIIIAILLVGFNALCFFLLNVHHYSMVVKRRLILLLVLVIILIFVILYTNVDKYIVAVNLSFALILIMCFRFVLFRILSRSRHTKQSTAAYQSIINNLLFPVFVIFLSIAQFIFVVFYNEPY